MVLAVRKFSWHKVIYTLFRGSQDKNFAFDIFTAVVSGFDSLTCLRRANTKSGKSRNEKGTMSPGWWLLRTEER